MENQCQLNYKVVIGTTYEIGSTIPIRNKDFIKSLLLLPSTG